MLCRAHAPSCRSAADIYLNSEQGTTARDLGLTTNTGQLRSKPRRPMGRTSIRNSRCLQPSHRSTGLGRNTRRVRDQQRRPAGPDRSVIGARDDRGCEERDRGRGYRREAGHQQRRAPGIDIVNLVSAAPDQVDDDRRGPGWCPARLNCLGIRSLKASTRTDTFNDGRGVSGAIDGRTDPVRQVSLIRRWTSTLRSRWVMDPASTVNLQASGCGDHGRRDRPDQRRSGSARASRLRHRSRRGSAMEPTGSSSRRTPAFTNPIDHREAQQLQCDERI